MKKLTKENSGITLITLIITIILMSILVSVTTYSGINVYRNMQVTKFVTQMQLIQAKVDELAKANNSEGLGEDITETQKNVIDLAYKNGEVKDYSDEYKSKYKYFSIENLKTQLDIDDIGYEVLINFDTREVVSSNGIEYKGNTYYTQYKLPNGETLVDSKENDRTLSFNTQLKFDGLNCTVQINDISITNGSLSFSEVNSKGNAINWQTITNYTETGKTYTTNISKSGNYIIRLQDNTDITKSFSTAPILITLTNKPKINTEINSYNYDLSNSEGWAYATDEYARNYVWIPRFVYKTDEATNITEIKFIKGNSNIATDNTYINSTWTTHSKFTLQDGTELTGIWINVNSANQIGLDMITLLNGDYGFLTEINL